MPDNKNRLNKQRQKQQKPLLPDTPEQGLQEEPVAPVVDTGIVEVPDIPLPAAEDTSEVIEDAFKGAFKFGIVGSGQGGARITEAFHSLGYNRVCTINTTVQDQVAIKIPEDNKLEIGTSGAGKNPGIAEAKIKERYEDVYDLMRRCFGVDYDRILITVGAGGGTGGGTVETLVKIAHDVLGSLKIEKEGECRVGVIVALPKNSEGSKVLANTYRLMGRLFQLVDEGKISPLIIIDNEKIKKIFPGKDVASFYPVANQSVCTLFHLYNTIACTESPLTTFDVFDFSTILDSGIITFGATPLAKWEDKTDISFAVRDNLVKNILGSVDIRTGNVAGCVVIGGKSVLTKVPEDFLDHAFEMLTRIMADGSTVHRGVYYGSKENLTVYTVIGGLEPPAERMKEISSVGGLDDPDVPE